MTRRVTAGIATALAVVGLASVSGGYFPHQWGILIAAFAVVGTTTALLMDVLEVSRRDVVFLGALWGFALWELTSAAWAPAEPAVLEGERAVIYAACASAVFVAVRRRTAPLLVAGVGLGSIAAGVLGLVEHLFPSDLRPAGFRLADPIGYANADGFLAAVGLLFALSLAATDGHRARRAISAAACVPLATGLYLSFSRGSFIALALGLAVLVAVEPRRLRFAATFGAVSISCLIAVLLAAHSPDLTSAAPLADIQAAGRRLAIELIPLCVISAVAAMGIDRLQLDIRTATRRRLAQVLALGGLVVVCAGVTVAGGPIAIARQGMSSFSAAPTENSGDLNARLLDVSGNARADYWRVALWMVEREPVVGMGAGSFHRWWLERRALDQDVRNAHNLYLETLAELGLVGLGLLLAALAVPLSAVRRARRSAGGPVAAAVYTAFLAHAALDWDWQIPLITLIAVVCGGALITLARGEHSVSIVTGGRRTALVLVALVPLVFAIGVHAGNSRVQAAQDALDKGQARRAVAEARGARRWLPWAASPWRITGEALTVQGQRVDAAAALRRALAADQEDWETWFDLSLVETGSRRTVALDRARGLNPRAPELVEP